MISRSWTPDGRSIIYISLNGRTVSLRALSGDEKPRTLMDSSFNKDEFHVSPDGRWIAYNSDESGRWEVYIARFPEFTERRQVSNAGGCQAQWRRDGKELFYLSLDGKLMVVEVRAGNTLETTIPRILFQTGVRVSPILDQYCVTGNGQRFLFMEPKEEDPEPIHVILNWPSSLGR